MRLPTIGAGSQTYVEKPLGCMEMSSLYLPLMPGMSMTLNKKEYPDWNDSTVVLACQHRCRQIMGCAHFNVRFPALECTLAAKNALLHHPVFNYIAGPAHCDVAMPKKASPGILTKTIMITMTNESMVTATNDSNSTNETVVVPIP